MSQMTHHAVGEMEQLSRQGVARFLGVAMTPVTLGVLSKFSKCNEEDGAVILVLSKRKYVFTKDSSRVADFLRVARQATVAWPTSSQGPCSDAGLRTRVIMLAMVNFAESVRRAVQSIGKATATLKTQTGEGYVTEFIVRRLCLAQLYVSANGQQLDWSPF